MISFYYLYSTNRSIGSLEVENVWYNLCVIEKGNPLNKIILGTETKTVDII